MTTGPKKAKGRTLAEFWPLLKAESILLAACESGDAAVIDELCPTEQTPVNQVRADFLRFIALGGDERIAIHEHGVQLRGAWIIGALDLEGTEVAFQLRLFRCHFAAVITIRNAQLNGGLNLYGSYLAGSSDKALMGDRALVKSSILLRDVIFQGEIRLVSAQIDGSLDFSNSTLNSEIQDTIAADGAIIKGNVFFNDANVTGTVRLVGARVGGDIDCTNAILNGKEGFSLGADRSIIEGNLFLKNIRTKGSIRISSMQIGGDITCTNAILDGRNSHALFADGAIVKGNFFLGQTTAIGEIRLIGIQILGSLECIEATLDGKTNDSLSIDNGVIKGSFIFRNLKKPVSKVSLVSTSIGQLVDDIEAWGTNLILDGFRYESIAGDAPTDAQFRLAWLDKQRSSHNGKNGEGTNFKPHPWKQLQKVLREMGHTEDARQVAIALENRLLHADLIGQTPKQWNLWRATPYRIIARTFHRLFKVFIGYGYRPIPLGMWMVAVWLFCAACFWYVALQGVMGPSNPLVFQNLAYAACMPGSNAAKIEIAKAKSNQPATQGAGNWYLCEKLPEEYTGFSPLAYSLDVLLPLVNLQQETDWAPLIPTPNKIWYKELGNIFNLKHATRILIWFEIIFGWIASLLMVAVVSGLTKRRED